MNLTNFIFKFYDPLIQFDIIERPNTCIYDFTVIFTTITDFIMLLQIIIILIFIWIIYEYYNTQNLKTLNEIFQIDTIITSMLTFKNRNYIDLFIIFFSLIFLCNIFGLIPYVQTITSQLIFTLFIALFIILVIWLHGLFNQKFFFINHFLPAGTPTWLIPLIIIIEIISTLSRIISLAVRLFANITSGHALLKILAGFALLTLLYLTIWNFLIIFPSIIIFIVTLLEFIIAFLQSYVFVTLLGVYVSEQEH